MEVSKALGIPVQYVSPALSLMTSLVVLFSRSPSLALSCVLSWRPTRMLEHRMYPSAQMQVCSSQPISTNQCCSFQPISSNVSLEIPSARCMSLSLSLLSLSLSLSLSPSRPLPRVLSLEHCSIALKSYHASTAHTHWLEHKCLRIRHSHSLVAIHHVGLL